MIDRRQTLGKLSRAECNFEPGPSADSGKSVETSDLLGHGCVYICLFFLAFKNFRRILEMCRFSFFSPITLKKSRFLGVKGKRSRLFFFSVGIACASYRPPPPSFGHREFEQSGLRENDRQGGQSQWAQLTTSMMTALFASKKMRTRLH